MPMIMHQHITVHDDAMHLGVLMHISQRPIKILIIEIDPLPLVPPLSNPIKPSRAKITFRSHQVTKASYTPKTILR